MTIKDPIQAPAEDDNQQFLMRLVQPSNDVIEARINGHDHVLCSSSNSALFSNESSSPSGSLQLSIGASSAPVTVHMLQLAIDLWLPFGRVNLKTIKEDTAAAVKEILEIKTPGGTVIAKSMREGLDGTLCLKCVSSSSPFSG